MAIKLLLIESSAVRHCRRKGFGFLIWVTTLPQHAASFCSTRDSECLVFLLAGFDYDMTRSTQVGSHCNIYHGQLLRVCSKSRASVASLDAASAGKFWELSFMSGLSFHESQCSIGSFVYISLAKVEESTSDRLFLNIFLTLWRTDFQQNPTVLFQQSSYWNGTIKTSLTFSEPRISSPKGGSSTECLLSAQWLVVIALYICYFCDFTCLYFLLANS